MFDVIILGAGVAGLSAALWCDELGLKTLVLEPKAEIGGQLLRVYNPIENHLGAPPAKNGLEMRDQIAAQISRRNFELRLGVEIQAVDLRAKTVALKNGELLSAQALILATGVSRRKLNIAGETKFRGRGILESGKRDSPFAQGKTVAIIGGGDAAAENALILAERAAKVYLIHRRNGFRAREEFLEKIRQNKKIEVMLETEVTKIIGRDGLQKIELQNSAGNIFQIEVAAILIRVGVKPNSELFQNQIELDENGYVKVNAECETSLQMVFAVGDLANPLSPTVSSAVGMGATAAKVLLGRLKF